MFEYKVLSFNAFGTTSPSQHLNQHAREGWKLISVSDGRHYLEREVVPDRTLPTEHISVQIFPTAEGYEEYGEHREASHILDGGLLSLDSTKEYEYVCQVCEGIVRIRTVEELIEKAKK